jgi:predicted branched-subunit amino acid permease
MGVVLWSIWSAAMGVGILVGSGLPGDIGLEWVATLMLIGLIGLSFGDRTHRRSALVGAAVAIAAGGVSPTFLPAVAALVAVAVAVASPSKEPDSAPGAEPEVAGDSLIDERAGAIR